MRDDQVANGVNFLTNSRVQSTPMDQKIDFLRSKGLTQEEVDEAVKQAKEKLGAGPSNDGGSVDGSASATSVATTSSAAPATAAQPQYVPAPQYAPTPQYAPAPPPPPTVIYQQAPAPETPLWARVLVPASLALSIGAGLAFLYKSYVLNEDWPRPGWGQMRPSDSLGGPASKSEQQTKLLHDSADAAVRGQANQPTTPASPWSRTDVAFRSPEGSADVARLARLVEQQNDKVGELCETLKALSPARGDSPLGAVAAGLGVVSGAGALERLLVQQSQDRASSDIRAELSAIKTILLADHVQKSSPRATLENIETMREASSAGNVETPRAIAAEGISVTAPEAETPNSADTKVPPKPTVTKPANATIDRLLEAARDGAPAESRKSDAASSATASKESAEASSPSASSGPSEEELAAAERKNLQAARHALAEMSRRQISQDIDMVPALNILLMYIKNLVKDPDVPRYRKIARQNSNFVRSLQPVDGHLEFLKSVGFEERSSALLEWSEEWRNNKDGWAKVVLQDAVQNLELLKQQCSASTQGANVVRSSAPSHSDAATSASTTVQPAFTANSPTVVSDHASAPSAVAAPIVTPTTTSQVDAVRTSSEPQYPKSFAEVMAMVQNGQTPGDVKQIPNQLSKDAEKLVAAPSSGPAPAKPWESVKDFSGSDMESFSEMLGANAALSSGPEIVELASSPVAS